MSKRELPITEDAVSKQFARRYKGKLAYVADVGEWRIFTGSHWTPAQKGEAHHHMRLLARELASRASLDRASAQRAAGRQAFVGGALRFAQTDPELGLMSVDFDRDPYLLGTPQGVIELRTGALRATRAGDRIARITSVSPAKTDNCPLFKAFLHEACGGDPALVRFLAQWFGYNLTGLTTEQVMVFIHGPGGNGKSVLLRIVCEILGDYARVANMEMFAASNFDRHPTELARMQGARLVTASETEGGKAWAEARIKTVTGGEPITARYMHRDFFTYQPEFKLTIIGNHEPSLLNVDDALRRRLIIVPFPHKPQCPDTRLFEKLMTELPAILRWMINGYLDWQAHGLVRPDVVTAGTNLYFDGQDVFGRWLEEECERTPGDRSRFETPVALYNSWKRFCEAEGEAPGTARSFYPRFHKIGMRSERRAKGQRRFEGIKIKRALATNGQAPRG